MEITVKCNPKELADLIDEAKNRLNNSINATELFDEIVKIAKKDEKFKGVASYLRANEII